MKSLIHQLLKHSQVWGLKLLFLLGTEYVLIFGVVVVEEGTQGVRLYPCETGEAETVWWGKLGEGALWGLKEHEEEWDNTHTPTHTPTHIIKNRQHTVYIQQSFLLLSCWVNLSILRFRVKFCTWFSLQINDIATLNHNSAACILLKPNSS